MTTSSRPAEAGFSPLDPAGAGPGGDPFRDLRDKTDLVGSVQGEPWIALREACEMVRAAGGKTVHLSSMIRWATRKRDPLEAWKVGGRWFTTASALRRFVDRCTASARHVPESPAAPPAPTAAARRRAAERAERELIAAGA